MALKERVEDNVALWLLGMLFTGFVTGIGAYKAILEIARLTVVPANSDAVTLDREVDRLTEENRKLRSENEQFKRSNAALTQRVENLVAEVQDARTKAAEPRSNRAKQIAGGPIVHSRSSAEARFVDHGDGTISDKTTRLMWTRQDSAAALGNCLSWGNSNAWVRGLRIGGHADWRMPSTAELKTIAGSAAFVSAASRHWSYEVGDSGNFLYVTWDSSSVGGWKGTACNGTGVRAVRQEGEE